MECGEPLTLGIQGEISTRSLLLSIWCHTVPKVFSCIRSRLCVRVGDINPISQRQRIRVVDIDGGTLPRGQEKRP